MVRNKDKEYEQFKMLRSLFNEIYAEVDELKKKKPDEVVNMFKVKRINRVLQPLYDLMNDEDSASFLELIPEPTEEKAGRSTIEFGLSYSDVSFVLSQYRGAINQFYQKHYSGVIDFSS